MTDELVAFDRAWIRKTLHDSDKLGQDEDWERLQCTDVVVYGNGWVEFTDPDGDEYHLPETEVHEIQAIDK